MTKKIKNADLNGLNILFIAYFFPPVISTNVPGAMRTVKFIRNMKNGNLHVLTTPDAVSQDRSALPHLIPPICDEKVHQVKSWDIFKFLLAVRQWIRGLLSGSNSSLTGVDADRGGEAKSVFKGENPGQQDAGRGMLQQFKDFLYDLCYFPDQAGPWVLPAIVHGRSIVKKQKIDVIFATGSPWSGLVAGYLISKVTGKPLVADFRDPWMNNPFHHSKGKLLDFWARFLERKVVHSADLVSLNTEPLKDDFLNRYPALSAEKFFVLPNGFDSSDVTDMEKPIKDGDDGVLILTHAGFLYGVRDPAVLLNAIRKANERLVDDAVQISFRQIGDVQLAYDIREEYQDMLDSGMLILDEPRPYKSCLTALSESDWVVNIQPGTKTQVPSKLYDYLAIDRPILNITDRGGALGNLVIKYQIGEIFDFNEEEQLSEWLVSVAQARNQSDVFESYQAKEIFDCRNISQILAEKFVDLAS